MNFSFRKAIIWDFKGRNVKTFAWILLAKGTKCIPAFAAIRSLSGFGKNLCQIQHDDNSVRVWHLLQYSGKGHYSSCLKIAKYYLLFNTTSPAKSLIPHSSNIKANKEVRNILWHVRSGKLNNKILRRNFFSTSHFSVFEKVSIQNNVLFFLLQEIKSCNY